MSPQFRSLVLSLTVAALVVIFARLHQQGIRLAFWRANAGPMVLLTLGPVVAAVFLGYATLLAVRWLSGRR